MISNHSLMGRQMFFVRKLPEIRRAWFPTQSEPTNRGRRATSTAGVDGRPVPVEKHLTVHQYFKLKFLKSNQIPINREKILMKALLKTWLLQSANSALSNH